MNEKYLRRHQFFAQFSYVGNHFHGVQEQPNLKTVLGALRSRIEASCHQSARSLVVSARTDRGVHALQNLATFYLRPPVDVKCFVKAACASGDDGLFSVQICETGPKMHARNVRHKTYCYSLIDLVPIEKIGFHPFAWQIFPPLSTQNMQKAAQYLLGAQDFSSLRGGGCQAGSPIKEIMTISVKRNRAGYILIDITGRGFLRKMVRNMVGLLVEVGAGFRPPESIINVMAQRDRAAAGIMAPAHGLCLTSIEW